MLFAFSSEHLDGCWQEKTQNFWLFTREVLVVQNATNRELEQKATRLLRSRGFTWAGNSKKKVSREQCSFRKRIIYTPVNGKVD